MAGPAAGRSVEAPAAQLVETGATARTSGAVQEVHAAGGGLVVEAEEVAAHPAAVRLRHREHGVDRDGGVGHRRPGLQELDSGERGEGMGRRHHALASEGDGAVAIPDLRHARGAVKILVISSCSKVGSGSWRAPSTSSTPCSRGTTWPMKWLSIPSRARAWITMPASAGAKVMSSAPEAMVPSGSMPNDLAQRRALGNHGDPAPVDAQSHARGVGQLVQGGGHAPLRRVVHGVHRGQLAGDLGLREHAEAGAAQQALGARHHRGRHTARAQLRLPLARDDGGALQGHALGEDDGVSDPSAARRHQLVPRDLAQHGPHRDGPIEPVRHLGVAADQGDLQLVARRAELREELRHRGLVGASFGQEQGGQEPPRPGPAHRDVVRVHLQDVPPELAGGKGDGIAGRHQVAVAHVDHGRILAEARPHDDTRIFGTTSLEQAPEERGAKLSHGQEPPGRSEGVSK